MIKLWHCHDARSIRSLWSLEELGLDYELKMLPFPPRMFQKDYLGENPLGTIPLLIDGDTRMTESAAILQYLEDRYGDGGLSVPVDHPEYGAYLNWLHHGEATLTFPQTLVFRYRMLEPPDRRNPQVAENYQKWFLARLRLMDQTLSDGREFLLLAGFTMADISVAYAIQFALTLGLRDELPPTCLDWYDRVTARDGYARAKQSQTSAGQAAGIQSFFEA